MKVLPPYEPVPPPPKEWGNDNLTRYLDSAYVNRFATFYRKRPEFDLLSSINNVFVASVEDWRDPENRLTPQFYLRSHSAYMTAVEHAMGAQPGETYSLLRLALEYIAYAALIHEKPELGPLWLKRQDGRDARKAVRNAFTGRAMQRAISSIAPVADASFKRLYELSIDMGAHPNELAITSATVIFAEDGRTHVMQRYLHTDGPALEQALRAAQETGLCVLQVAARLFASRFELLGLTNSIEAIQAGFASA